MDLFLFQQNKGNIMTEKTHVWYEIDGHRPRQLKVNSLPDAESDRFELQDLAEQAADDHHNNHDGQESSWPLTVTLFFDKEATQRIGSFEVECEYVATFNAETLGLPLAESRYATRAEHAESGNVTEMINVAEACFTGKYIAKNNEKGLELLELAIVHGSVDARYQMAEFYLGKWGDPVDAEKGVLMMAEAANKGHDDAEIRMGRICHEGKLIPQDWDSAVRWLEKASEKPYNYRAKDLLKHVLCNKPLVAKPFVPPEQPGMSV
jgi:TPR repeat protein